MSIVSHLNLNCELTVGSMSLRLLFLLLFLLIWIAYREVYPRGWAAVPAQEVPRSWRLLPRTPDCLFCMSKRAVGAGFSATRGCDAVCRDEKWVWRRKTLPTAGHACPHPACAYFAVTAAHLHAVVGNGKRGQRQDIQYWKCQACDKKFTSRLHTPLYQMKTDPEKVTLGLGC